MCTKYLVKHAQEKNAVRCTDRLNIATAVDWDVKPQIISLVKHMLGVLKRTVLKRRFF